MGVDVILLVLGGAAVFGVFAGVAYYFIDRAEEEQRLLRLQYINSLIQSCSKKKYRTAKRRNRQPKGRPLVGFVGRVHKH